MNLSFAIPEILVPCSSSRMEDVVTISKYTYDNHSISPFAFLKEIGKGELLYVEVFPYFSALEDATDSVRRSLFSKLGMFFDALGLPKISLLSKRTAAFNYSYILSEGKMNLTNNIRIKSSSLFFPDLENVQIKSIDFSETDYVKINGTKNNDRIYYNLTVSGLEVQGTSYSLLNSNNVSFGSIDKKRIYGTYVLTQMASGFNWTLNLSSNTYVTMELINQTKSKSKVELLGGRVKFSFIPSPAPILIYLQNPSVFLHGDIKIDKANVYTMPYHATVVGSSIKITGNSSFSIDRSDTLYTFISNFDSNGTIIPIQATITHKISVPWKEILSSPIHLFLLISISVFLILRIRGSK